MIRSPLRFWHRWTKNRPARRPKTRLPRLRLGMEGLECRQVPANVIGLNNNNELIQFDTASPGSATKTTVSGLAVGERIIGIDYRPATEQLYAISNVNANVYTLNKTTGAATLVGSGGVAITGSAVGFDFNPLADRIRLVTSAGENFRIHPTTAIASTDKNITGDTSSLVAAAYTNNFAGTASTKLFGIDAGTDRVYLVDPPNDGVTTKLSATLGFDTDDNVGFDIGIDGTAYAALTVAGVTGLYTVDLTTGAATFVGAVQVSGAGETLSGLTVVPDGNAPPFITTSIGSAKYTAGGPAILVNQSGIAGDPDSPNFNTGVLTVTITANADADDRLGILNQGTAPGQVGVSGSDVTFSGTTVGTFTGGSGSTPLAITFNANADAAAVQAVLRAVTFSSVAAFPPAATRTVQFGLTDDLGAASNTVSRDVTIDLPPLVVSLDPVSPDPAKNGPVDFEVVFDEPVTGVDVTDFNPVTLGSIAGATVTNVTGSGTKYTVTVTTTSGSGALALDLIDDDSIMDLAGNPLGGVGGGNGDFQKGGAINIDGKVPSVANIVRAGTNPTNAASVDFTVTFDEDVTGVDAADFTLTTTGGVAGAAVTGVAGSGKSYTVTVSTGTITAPATLRLDLTDDDSIADKAGNPLGGTGAGNGDFTTGEAYSLTLPPPAVVSSVRADTDPTNAGTVNFTVTFSRDVTGVDVADFALTATGVSGATITGVTGSGKTYTVTADTGTGDGTLRLDVIDDDTIVDTGGTPLGGTGTGNGDFTTGEEYTLDRTDPTVSAIVRADADPTKAATVTFTVTFTEDVTGVDAADFTLVPTGTVTGATITGVTGSGKSYTVTVDTGTGEGTLGLNLVDDDTVLDAAGNFLGGAGLGNGDFTGELYTIDRTAPTVVSITRLDPDPTAATSVKFQVTFDEAVTGVDAADFALNQTGTVAGAKVASVTGSGTTYTVTVDSFTGDGTLRLDLIDDDTVVDLAGNELGGAGAGNGDFTTGEAYTVAQPPVVVSSVRVNPSPTNAATVDFTVTFSEDVTGVDAADFALTATGTLAGATITGVTGAGSVYTVSVSTGSGDGTLRLDVIDDDSIADLAGNSLGGTGAGNGDFTTGEEYTLDRTDPAVSAIVRADADPTKAATVSFTVTFSEDVTGVDAADFTLVPTGTVTGATITGVTGSGNTYTVTVDTGTGEGTLGLNLTDDDSILDLAGNILGGAGAGNGDFTGEVYTIDRTAPAVVSITRLDPDPTAAQTVTFQVTFDEAVTGVDAADFKLTTTGSITKAAVTGVTGTGTTYTVTVDTGFGDGTIRLDLIDDDTVVDLAGNELGGAGAGNGDFTTGEAYTVARPPVVVTSVRANPSPTNAGTVDFTVTFSEDVTGVDLADFALTTTGTLAGAAVVNVTGSGAVYTVSVKTTSGDGTLRLDVLDDDSIVDVDSNPLGGTGTGNGDFTTGEAYTVDRIAPTPTVDQDTGQADPAAGEPVLFLVTFDEDVTGFDQSDIILGGTAGATTVAVTSIDARTYLVTVTGTTGNGTVTIDFKAGAAADLAGNASVAPILTDNSVTIVAGTANLPPTITAPASVTTAEGSKFTFAAGSLKVADPDVGAGELLVTLTGTNGTITLASKSGLTFVTGDGDADAAMSFKGKLADVQAALDGLVFDSGPDFNGAGSLKIDVDDQGNTGSGGAKQATATVAVDVTAVNDAPVVTIDTGTGELFGDEDTVFTFPDNAITITDVDAGNGILQLAISASVGTVTLARTTGLTFVVGDGTNDAAVVIQGTLADLNAAVKGLKYTPPQDFNGAVDFKFVADDRGNTGAGGALTDTGTVEVTIRAANDGPTITAPGSVNVPEDGTLIFTGPTAISITDIDADSGALRITLAATNGTITLSQTTGLTFTAGDGTGDASMTFTGTLANVNAALNNLRFNPTANFNGAASLTITADDQGNSGTGGSKTDTRTVNITVDPGNDGPTANADSFTTAQNQPLTVPTPGVLANDTDPEGNPLTAILVTDIPAGTGRLQLQPTGGFIYEPAPNFVGTVTFQYRASDGTLQSSPVTVTITVTAQSTRLTATGAGPGGTPQVLVYNPDGTLRFSFLAFDAAFNGGVSVATGDVDGDGVEDIITGAGPGAAPHVMVYSGANARPIRSLLGFDGDFPFGVNVAAGDVNGDGFADIIVGAMAGSVPHVRVFDGRFGGVLQDFFAYDVAFKGGVNVSAGDVNGDGRAEVVTGAGPGGAPHIIVYENQRPLLSYLGLDAGFSGGVRVASGRFNGNPAVFAAAGPGGLPTVNIFDNSATSKASLSAFSDDFSGGVRVATELLADGTTALIMAKDSGDEPDVRVVDGTSLVDIRAFDAFDPSFLGGVFVG